MEDRRGVLRSLAFTNLGFCWLENSASILGNIYLTRDLGDFKELRMFVEKYFYGTESKREESLLFYRLFCIRSLP